MKGLQIVQTIIPKFYLDHLIVMYNSNIQQGVSYF